MGFSERITRLRKDRKIAQNELAKNLGIHPNVLGRYERGEASPSIETVVKIADELGVSIDYLVGKTDVEIDSALLDKIAAIQQLPDEDRHCIMYSLNGLIQHAKTRIAYQ